MRMGSIQRQLIGTVLLLELLSALAVTTIAYFHERHTVFHAFDVMLRGQADSLLGAVQDAEDKDDNVMLNLADVHAPQRDQYLAKDEKGRVLGATALASLLRLPPNMKSGSVVPLRVEGRPYRAIVVHGSRWIDAAEPSGGVIRYVTVMYASPANRAWELIWQTVLFYALASLVVMAFTAGWLLWSLRRTLAPLEGLAQGAAKLTPGAWNFEAPPEARNTAELRPLVAAIEQSIAGIQSAFQKQQRFVGDAAHELKTAVAVVKSSLQLVTIRQRTEEEYRAGIERCQQDIVRLEALVQQMLTLARAESRPEKTAEISDGEGLDVCDRTDVCDLFAVAQGVAEELRPVAEMQGVRIAVEGTSAPAKMPEAEAATVMENIVSNAIRFSPAGGEVVIRVLSEGEQVWISVRDQGPGIALEDRESVFERFWRGDPSRSRQTGGSGLGLSIAQAIVERRQGEIRIADEARQGTTVMVGIPAAATLNVREATASSG